MKVTKLVFLCCLCPLLRCHGASVRLLTGESYTGRVEYLGGALTVTPSHGAAVRVDLSNLLEAVIIASPAESGGMIPAGVFLANGSFIAGKSTPFNAPTVKIGTSTTVSGSSIAQVVYAPVRRENLPASGRTGALLPSGQFFAGMVGGVSENRVLVNSLLIGPQRLVPGAEVTCVAIRDIQSGPVSYEVCAKDGSIYPANNLRFEADGVAFTDSILGNIKIKGADLVEIRAASGRYQALVEATPAQIAAPPGANPGNALKVQPETNAATPEGVAALLALANTTVTYAIPPGLSVFSCSVAVPKDAPAGARMVFTVYADGRVMSVSPIIGAGEPPQAVRVNLGMARALALRTEPMGPASGGAAGKWIEPILLRP